MQLCSRDELSCTLGISRQGRPAWFSGFAEKAPSLISFDDHNMVAFP